MDTATITDNDGFTISSNHETVDELRESLPVVEDTPAVDAKAADTPRPAKVDKRTREGKVQSIQQEIDSVYAKKKDAEREFQSESERLTKVRAEIADLEAKRTTRAAERQPDPVTSPVSTSEYKRYMAMDDAPKNDGSFTNYDEYAAALSVFIADKRYDERRAADSVNATTAQRTDAFLNRLTEADKVDPKWSDKVAPEFIDPKIAAKPISHLKQGEHGTYRNGIAEVILTSENPVGLMQYLSAHQHDADIQRLSTLPPDQFFRQMGRLEARLEAAHSVPASPRKEPISQAKPLIKTVSGSAQVPSDDDALDDDSSDADIDKHWGHVIKGSRR